MPNHSEIWDAFRRRPAMYTGEFSLSSIQSFLVGYSFALDRYEKHDPEDGLYVPLEFNDWVAYRFHFYESTAGWCNMIYSKGKADDVAIPRFFELLDEFRQRKPRLVARLIGHKSEGIRTSYRREGERLVTESTEVVTFPNSVALVTYTEDPGFFAYSETEEDFSGKGFHPSVEHFELSTSSERRSLTIIDPTWAP